MTRLESIQQRLETLENQLEELREQQGPTPARRRVSLLTAIDQRIKAAPTRMQRDSLLDIRSKIQADIGNASEAELAALQYAVPVAFDEAKQTVEEAL